jgi:hypothetical protein
MHSAYTLLVLAHVIVEFYIKPVIALFSLHLGYSACFELDYKLRVFILEDAGLELNAESDLTEPCLPTVCAINLAAHLALYFI